MPSRSRITKTQLINVEEKALALKNEGNIEQATALFEQLVREEPSWEHGYGFLSLAECYEDLGKYAEARTAYDKAIQTSPDDPNILGNFASFLYLRGEPGEAFQAYLKLLRLESSHVDQTASESTKVALRTLAEKVGMPKSTLDAEIAFAASEPPKPDR